MCDETQGEGEKACGEIPQQVQLHCVFLKGLGAGQTRGQHCGATRGQCGAQQGRQEVPAPFSLENLSLLHAHGSHSSFSSSLSSLTTNIHTICYRRPWTVRKAAGWGWTGRSLLPRDIVFLPALCGFPPICGNEQNAE